MSATTFQHRPLLRGTGALAATTLAFALLTGCGDSTDEETPGATDGASEPSDPAEESEPPADDGATETEETTVIPPDDGASATALPTNEVPEEIVQAEETQEAVTDLAEREGVSEDEVTVAGYREVNWRDGSIGCPEPGQHYTMALVPGRQLILAVDDTLFAYNAADGKPYSFCADPQDPAPGESR